MEPPAAVEPAPLPQQIEGRLHFEQNQQGATIARLQTSGAQAALSLYGAQVISFRPAGHEHDVIWMGHYQPAEGKDCWGGIPLCWPWFMLRLEPPQGPFHGFGRFSLWEVLGADTPNPDTTRLRLGLRDSPETREKWPYAFQAELVVTLTRDLDLELITHNTGDAPFRLEHCFHSYFNVGDVTRVRIYGLEGGEIEDNAHADAPRTIQHGPVEVPGHMARVARRTPGPHRIEDPLWRRDILIEKRGSTQTVLWNSGPVRETNGHPTGEPDWQTQLALEPLRGLEDALVLEPGKTARLGMTIRATNHK